MTLSDKIVHLLGLELLELLLLSLGYDWDLCDRRVGASNALFSRFLVVPEILRQFWLVLGLGKLVLRFLQGQIADIGLRFRLVVA